MLKFIDLKRGDGVSSLAASGRHKNSLQVIGVLPHGVEIAPRDTKAAHELIDWLSAWIERNPDAG